MPRKDTYQDCGLLCPRCESHRHGVYDSRGIDGVVMRLRQCVDCGARFRTKENIVKLLPPTRKRKLQRVALRKI